MDVTPMLCAPTHPEDMIALVEKTTREMVSAANVSEKKKLDLLCSLYSFTVSSAITRTITAVSTISFVFMVGVVMCILVYVKCYVPRKSVHTVRYRSACLL